MKTKKKNKYFLLLLILFVALFVFFVVSLCCGHYTIKPASVIGMLFKNLFGIIDNNGGLDETVLFDVRLPRIVGAMIIGACLAISGTSYQSVFQNPLVSPDILGVSSGACIGAALAIIINLPRYLVIVLSFLTGIITVAVTMLIPKIMKSNSNIMLVLSGIIVSGLTTSIMGIIKYVADPLDELPRITYWTMGSLDGIDYYQLLVTIIPIVICALILLRISWWIDIISLGEKDAKTLGANVKKLRLIIIVCSTFLTAISVSLCGTIGWIGLVIPHFGRLIVGPSNTKLIPISGILGAIFLLIIDTVSRTIALVELPLSIVTGFIGAPFYAMFLYRERRNIN